MRVWRWVHVKGLVFVLVVLTCVPGDHGLELWPPEWRKTLLPVSDHFYAW